MDLIALIIFSIFIFKTLWDIAKYREKQALLDIVVLSISGSILMLGG